MEAFLVSFLADPRLHVLAVVVLSMIFRCRIKNFFCKEIIVDMAHVKKVQDAREGNYKKIDKLESEIEYMKKEHSGLAERYKELDVKMDEMSKLLVSLNTKMDLMMKDKNKGE